jgi:hypothetical protein
MSGDDKTPGWVAFFISVLVCFPCACCAGFYTVYHFVAVFRPDWASQVAGLEQTYPSSLFGFYSLVCSCTTVIALVGGIVLLIWGIRRLRTRRA